MHGRDAAVALLAVALLAGVGWSGRAQIRSDESEAYHARIRSVAALMPGRIGPWVGSDLEVPRSAIQLLKPNVLVSRVFYHRETEQVAAFLLVQTADARDLLGHYPPHCYPANGWTQRSAEERLWTVAGLEIPAMRYGFSFEDPDGEVRAAVVNFMLTPDGRIQRDMEGTQRAAARPSRRALGAAQVHVVVDGDLGDEALGEVVRDLVGGHALLLRELLDGPRAPGRG